MRRRHARRTAALVAVLLGAAACGGEAPGSREVDRAPDPLLGAPPAELARSLARAAGAAPYAIDTVARPGGRLLGTVRYDGELPPDTLVRPTHDTHACRPVPDAPIAGTRDGVADAIAWLVGVTHGAADEAPRRVTLTLEGCRIVPRVLRAPQGATLLVRSADAMDSRLRFVEAGAPRAPAGRAAGPRDSTAAPVTAAPVAPRALVPLGDAGAVVPVTTVTERPGLVEIRDDRHPWVRGWLAVAPHPFVAISDRDGRFTFDGVPPGRYVLVTWHERLGTVATPVLVEAGVELRVTVTLPAVG